MEVARARGRTATPCKPPGLTKGSTAPARRSSSRARVGTWRALRACSSASPSRPDDAPIIEEVDAVRRADQCQGAGRRYLFVDAGGDVHACPFCHGVAGNCLRDGLDAALAEVRAFGCQQDKAVRLFPLRLWQGVGV